MLARSLVIVVLLALSSAGAPAQVPTPQSTAAPDRTPSPARSARNANYTITANLNPATRTLKGDALLTWRNVTSQPATSLRFHLYYNAWRNTRSSWMREGMLGGDTTLAERPEQDWGWIDITSIRVIGAGGAPADLTSRLRFIAPDDGNIDDRTLVELPLDAPVAPGATANVQITWASRVPRTFARTGTIGNFYFLAQWFPKIGVLEESGWNAHQFHAATEFFSDFGVYDVRLTVPQGWIVGATGQERGRRDEGDGTVTHHYQANDVHDFAWTTSPDYLERTAAFEHPGLPAVAMRLLLQPEHASQADRHFDATRATLRYYGEWFGPYPYPNITVIDPAWQSDAGGMDTRRSSPQALAGWRRAVSRNRRVSPFTRPATSSGTGSSRPTSSSTPGWTKGSTRSRRPGRSSSSSSRIIQDASLVDSCRGCSTICRCHGRPKATGCPLSARTRAPMHRARRRGGIGRTRHP